MRITPKRTLLHQLRKAGHKVIKPHCVCYTLPAKSFKPFVLVIIPKKIIRESVDRNLWRRRFKFIARTYPHFFYKHILFVAKSDLSIQTYQTILNELTYVS